MKDVTVKVTKELTDYQLVEAAERLMAYNPKHQLPRGYTLKELWQAEQKLNDIAANFIDKYGSRLEGLAPDHYRAIKSWKFL